MKFLFVILLLDIAGNFLFGRWVGNVRVSSRACELGV